jgi:hypothetical protein
MTNVHKTKYRHVPQQNNLHCHLIENLQSRMSHFRTHTHTTHQVQKEVGGHL